ncbi:MAG: hypothetical protein R3309_04945 [Reinekea sp.]|nr:hypothetical protein [Reinekea sp.]
MSGIPGLSFGTGEGDLSFDTGAGGNDQLSTGSKTDVKGDSYDGGFGGSVNNVNFQFMPNSNGNKALDFAAGFFKDTSPQVTANKANTQKVAIYAGASVLAVVVLAVVFKGRK